MTLKEFIDRSGLKGRFIAQRLGISRCYLSLIKNGHRQPSAELARAIQNFARVRGYNIDIGGD